MWQDYYGKEHNYGQAGLDEKQKLVAELVAKVQPASCWDLGANTGTFSRLAARQGPRVVALEMDPACAEIGFQLARRDNLEVQSLWMDLANPSPALGWAHTERRSLAQRGPADLIMALALIHHLRISANVPFRGIAEYFRQLGRHVLVEWVPRGDEQVVRLLGMRADTFPDYTPDGFDSAMERFFTRVEAVPIPGSERQLRLYGA